MRLELGALPASHAAHVPPTPACQRDRAHRPLVRSHRLPALRPGRRRMCHRYPQTRQCRSGSSSAADQAQCQVHRRRTIRRHPRSPPHSPGTSADLPKARIPQHTDCILPLSPAHPGAHGWHAVMSSLGSVPPSQAAQVPLDPAKPVRAEHAYRATRCQARCLAHTPRRRHPCQQILTAHGRHSVRVCTRLISRAAQHAAATGASCPGSAQLTQDVLSSFGVIAIAACRARPV